MDSLQKIDKPNGSLFSYYSEFTYQPSWFQGRSLETPRSGSHVLQLARQGHQKITILENTQKL